MEIFIWNPFNIHFIWYSHELAPNLKSGSDTFHDSQLKLRSETFIVCKLVWSGYAFWYYIMYYMYLVFVRWNPYLVNTILEPIKILLEMSLFQLKLWKQVQTHIWLLLQSVDNKINESMVNYMSSHHNFVKQN